MIKKIVPIALLGAALISNTGCKHEPEFKKLKGMEYMIVKDTHGKKAQIGDFVEFNLVATVDTMAGKPLDTLGNSYKMPQPPIRPVDTARTGDWGSVIPMMAAGDSAVISISCDTLIKLNPPGQRMPPFIKKGNKIMVYLSIISIKSKEQYDSERQAKQAEMQKKMQDEEAQQKPIDEKLLQDYFAKNNLKPEKTASGLYYIISKPGAGPNPKPGQMVTMNYTGKTLDGNTFDSNEDPKFKHTDPFSFPLGQGRVIPGWDEGVALLKKGSKATFYIPSALGYGPRAMGQELPANSVLVFNVTVTDIKDAPPPQPGKGGMQMRPQQQPQQQQ